MRRTRALAVVVVAALVVAMGAVALLGIIALSEEYGEKTYCRATAEGNFADNAVIVILTERETRRFKDYDADDFDWIGAVEVQELTCFTKETAKKQLSGERVEHELVNIEQYRTMLRITLSEHSKENVLAAIKKLERRHYVKSAAPEGYVILA